MNERKNELEKLGFVQQGEKWISPSLSGDIGKGLASTFRNCRGWSVKIGEERFNDQVILVVEVKLNTEQRRSQLYRDWKKESLK